MFMGHSSLNGWLSISRLDHDSFLIVKVCYHVKTFFSVTLSIQFLSSLKFFIHLLRSFKEVYIHLSLFCHNFSIWSMLLLREIKADGQIKRTDLGLHHSLHPHNAWLHIWVRGLHKLVHSRIPHHHAWVHSSCSCSHHHLLRWAAHSHPHVHASSHHHLIVRVPHLSLNRLSLMDNVDRHCEETELPTESGNLLLLRLRRVWHHWGRKAPCQRTWWANLSQFMVSMSERATIFKWTIFA